MERSCEIDAFEVSTYRLLLAAAATSFMLLPFITTFNELLTSVVEHLCLVAYLQEVVAPFLAAAVAAILRIFFGLDTAVSGSYLYVVNSFMPLRVYVSWNCVGWQSFVLLFFILATGLQGKYTIRSKLLCILLGFEGTFLLNIFRLVVPCLLAINLGYLPAIIFHDYIGTILTLAWFALFWHLSLKHLLKQNTEELAETSSTEEDF